MNDKWKQGTDRLAEFIPFIVLHVICVTLPFLVYAFSGPDALCINDSYKNALSTLDYFYYSVVTLTTLGYGDIYPCSILAKWFVIFQSVAGPALIGVLLVAIANDISKERAKKYKNCASEFFSDIAVVF